MSKPEDTQLDARDGVVGRWMHGGWRDEWVGGEDGRAGAVPAFAVAGWVWVEVARGREGMRLWWRGSGLLRDCFGWVVPGGLVSGLGNWLGWRCSIGW